MFRIIDRYIIRELILPFLLGLVVFTFLLMIQPLADYSEQLISKGVSWTIVVRVLVTLVPQALAIAIPIALLIGLLIAFGRLSADRESVAFMACGISIYRLLRPVLFVAALAWAATSWIMIDALPDANQSFREIVYGVITARADNEIKPRVFFEDFPNQILYIGDAPTRWWRTCSSDTSKPEADRLHRGAGRLAINKASARRSRAERRLEYTANLKEPSKYEVARFAQLIIGLDPNTVFNSGEISKGDNEMTIAELNQRVAELKQQKLPAHSPIMALHRKFSIPVACLVFGVIGLALGLQHGRGGKLAAFVPGIAVVFIYYVIEYMGRQMAKGQLVSPPMAVWAPDIVLGAGGFALLFWRARSADKPIRVSIPDSWQVWRRFMKPAVDATEMPASVAAVAAKPSPAKARRVVLVVRVPRVALPSFRLLDGYVTKLGIKIASLTFIGLLGIFYISTFIDMSDKLFKGQTTGSMMLEYFFYQTPQFVFLYPPDGADRPDGDRRHPDQEHELVVMQACESARMRRSWWRWLRWQDYVHAAGRVLLTRTDAWRRCNSHPRRLTATFDVVNASG